jgi:glucose-1-phosphate thymidylyltransferase
METRGIILSGGLGSRLRPITHTINKNLIPVGPQPMLLYPVKKCAEAGITELCLTTGPEHAGAIVNLLGDGSDYKVSLTYRMQKVANGISAAIALAESFADNSNVLVLLGDNLFDAPLTPIIEHFKEFPEHALVYTYKVPDPQRFGVIEYKEDGTPLRIIEKPQTPPSNDAVIGVYAYPAKCNGKTPFDYIRTLKPSARGELEVTDLNNVYLEMGKLKVHSIEGFWVDAGTFPTLKKANEWAWSKYQE